LEFYFLSSLWTFFPFFLWNFISLIIPYSLFLLLFSFSLWTFIQSRSHFGFLPFFLVNPDLDEATGQNDAGVAMLNAYNYVHDQSSSTDGLAFITSCYNKVSDIEFCLDSRQNIAGFLFLCGNFVDFL
jgi:hypothetical protein